MKRVMVAMSGGVDSSVAAVLLKEKGYDVIGGTMVMVPEYKLNIKNEKEESLLSYIDDAKEVAKKLGITHYVFDFRDIFKEKIIDYFANEYKRARTPNPCIMCNKEIKFQAFMEKAFELDADFIATGHFAKIVYDNGRYLLKIAGDMNKDQTYYLYILSQLQLKHTLMPLGEHNKEEIRLIARNIGLNIYNKPDSQDICFIPDNDYRGFLIKNYNYIAEPGPILDLNGNILGEHRGLPYYTIGQRKGLGLALAYPVYVVKLDKDNNAVIVGEDKDVFSKSLIADNLNWISIERLNDSMDVNVKIRYNSSEAKAKISPEGEDEVKVIFIDKQRAVTPGQSVVFYDGDIVVGGGIVKKNL
jgi:tRNA-uridine 2-sulfurtransferase